LTNKTKITVVGSGYVGNSLTILLVQNNDEVVLDADASRVEKVNNKQSTVGDAEIEAFLADNELRRTAIWDKQVAYDRYDRS
jgi:UDPglucose 6-dehydrogenase